MNHEFDQTWEKKYASGHKQLYPWDAVVSFIFSNVPNHVERKNINILEVGCGTASNLWFGAREGFSVAGIDASSSAINFAVERFKTEELVGDFRVGSFTKLPFQDNQFDIVIDRCALTHTGMSNCAIALSEIYRVMKVGAKFLSRTFSKHSPSYLSGEHVGDGLVDGITVGALMNVGQVCFYDQDELESMFKKFSIRKMSHIVHTEITGNKSTNAVWHVEVEK